MLGCCDAAEQGNGLGSRHGAAELENELCTQTGEEERETLLESHSNFDAVVLAKGPSTGSDRA